MRKDHPRMNQEGTFFENVRAQIAREVDILTPPQQREHLIVCQMRMHKIRVAIENAHSGEGQMSERRLIEYIERTMQNPT